MRESIFEEYNCRVKRILREKSIYISLRKMKASSSIEIRKIAKIEKVIIYIYTEVVLEKVIFGKRIMIV